MNNLKFTFHRSLKNSGSTAVTSCHGMIAAVGIRSWAQQIAFISRSSSPSSLRKQIRNESTTNNHKLKFAPRGDQPPNRFMKALATSPSFTSASIIAMLLFLTLATRSNAQCDKPVVLTSSKTEYLNAAGVVQRTVDEQSVIKISKSEVTIAPHGHDVMTGAITSTVCEWKSRSKRERPPLRLGSRTGTGAKRPPRFPSRAKLERSSA